LVIADDAYEILLSDHPWATDAIAAGDGFVS
jgi:hypothetical protein